MPLNFVKIKHLAETVTYELKVDSFSFEGGLLNLDLETEPVAAGPFSHLPAPTLHIEDATMDSTPSMQLADQQLNVKTGWDTDEIRKTHNIFRMYLSQHLALNDNIVDVKRENGILTIDWKCTCQNIIYFKNPDNHLRAHCVIPYP